MFGRSARLGVPVLVASVLLIHTTARADKITLKDGRVLDGKIEREDDASVTIRLQFGEMTVEKARIDKIERGKTDLEVHAERKAALAADDVDGRVELAKWCEKTGLSKQADELWAEVIGLDPAHVEAKARGYTPDGGKKSEKAPAEEAAAVAEEEIRKKLAEIPLHLEFVRAPIEDILAAWGRATEMGIKLESEARKGLIARKFTMNYECTDRPADLVLEDIAKFAALDYILKPGQVILSTPRRIRIIRREEGLPRGPQRLDADDVRDLLDKKKIDLDLRDQPLRALSDLVKKQTGVPVVLSSGVDPDAKLSHKSFDEPLSKSLDEALAKIGLGYSIQGGSIYITERGGAERRRGQR